MTTSVTETINQTVAAIYKWNGFGGSVVVGRFQEVATLDVVSWPRAACCAACLAFRLVPINAPACPHIHPAPLQPHSMRRLPLSSRPRTPPPQSFNVTLDYSGAGPTYQYSFNVTPFVQIANQGSTVMVSYYVTQ